jgi:hypothetical protein
LLTRDELKRQERDVIAAAFSGPAAKIGFEVLRSTTTYDQPILRLMAECRDMSWHKALHPGKHASFSSTWLGCPPAEFAIRSNRGW